MGVDGIGKLDTEELLVRLEHAVGDSRRIGLDRLAQARDLGTADVGEGFGDSIGIWPPRRHPGRALPRVLGGPVRGEATNAFAVGFVAGHEPDRIRRHMADHI